MAAPSVRYTISLGEHFMNIVYPNAIQYLLLYSFYLRFQAVHEPLKGVGEELHRSCPVGYTALDLSSQPTVILCSGFVVMVAQQMRCWARNPTAEQYLMLQESRGAPVAIAEWVYPCTVQMRDYGFEYR